jgi:hypothetical protein
MQWPLIDQLMMRVVIGLPKVHFDLSSSKLVSLVETFFE